MLGQGAWCPVVLPRVPSPPCASDESHAPDLLIS